MVRQEAALLRSKALDAVIWLDRPAVQHILWERCMHPNLPVVLEGQEVLVEEGIDVRGKHDPVCAIEALQIGGVAPGFDVAGNQ